MDRAHRKALHGLTSAFVAATAARTHGNVVKFRHAEAAARRVIAGNKRYTPPKGRA